jgi:hypothetical protein
MARSLEDHTIAGDRSQPCHRRGEGAYKSGDKTAAKPADRRRSPPIAADGGPPPDLSAAAATTRPLRTSPVSP